MKKSMIALTMAFALVLSLCACGGQNSNTPSGKTHGASYGKINFRTAVAIFRKV